MRIGLLQLGHVYQICRSEAKTIRTIVMWTVQSDRVLTVCYRSRRRRAKTQGGRGHLLTWAVPSCISVTIWLTAVTFNGLKAVVGSALSQAWPVMVSLHWGGGGVRNMFPNVSSHLWVLTLDICLCQHWECPSVRKDTKEVGTASQYGQWF